MKIFLTLLIYSISISLNNLFRRTQYENVTYKEADEHDNDLRVYNSKVHYVIDY